MLFLVSCSKEKRELNKREKKVGERRGMGRLGALHRAAIHRHKIWGRPDVINNIRLGFGARGSNPVR